MPEIYAASLSVGQGSRETTVSASLILSHEGTLRELTLEWPGLGHINPGLDVSEWLYSALSRLVMNYDEHTLTEGRVRPLSGVEGESTNAS